jgi:putative ABC transport system permease protein
LARSTADSGDAGDPFVVLERFHLAIALVTVITSSTFLLALMVMVVEERREAVAVLRLIGLSRRRILLQVLTEGLILALAGVVFGVLLAEVVEGVFNRFFQWHYDTMLTFVRITPRVVVRSTLLAVPLGIVASLASSWNLLRRDVLTLTGR